MIAEYNRSGQLTAKYVYGNGMRLVKVDGSGNKFYLHTDQLGSTRVVTNASKTTVQRNNYLPFGDTLYQYVAGTGTDYKFNGKELDEEQDVNLYYYGARYYDPKIGRFISIDPIVNYTNPYSYVRNNPINLTDPSGMEPPGIGNVERWYEGRNINSFAREGKLGLPDLSNLGSDLYKFYFDRPKGAAEGGGIYINKLWLASFRLFALHFLEMGPLVLEGQGSIRGWRFSFDFVDGSSAGAGWWNEPSVAQRIHDNLLSYWKATNDAKAAQMLADWYGYEIVTIRINRNHVVNNEGGPLMAGGPVNTGLSWSELVGEAEPADATSVYIEITYFGKGISGTLNLGPNPEQGGYKPYTDVDSIGDSIRTADSTDRAKRDSLFEIMNRVLDFVAPVEPVLPPLFPEP